MKTYHERTEDVLNKIQIKKKHRRRARAGIALGTLAAVLLVLFFPLDFGPPSMWQYRGSPYYELICKVSAAKYDPPQYENLADALTSAGALDLLPAPGASAQPDAEPAVDDAPLYGTSDKNGNGQYEEVTDNQVAGVIEGDLIKRSDRHIYYLRKGQLAVYSIAGADSALVGSYDIHFENKANVSWLTAQTQQMYLSEDCTCVTLLLSGYGDVRETGSKEYFLCAVSLDVSDPANILETNRLYLTGSYLSSRLVDGKLLLMSLYTIPWNVDYAKPETYVPQIGGQEEMACIPAGSIIAPDTLSDTSYTVVTMLDQKTLDVTDTAAFLSYNSQVYVSADKIFATRSYTDSEKTLTKGIYTSMTEIACLSYGEDGLEDMGSVRIEGTVKNQYSMDEHDGVLRVVASTSYRESSVNLDAGYEFFPANSSKRNVNLYCVRLADWEILAKVEAFAPEGETAESVRFDGDHAYVCTAEVVTLTDPVYFFDLSDLENITWKDTGTIDGYSSSLVNFGNGNLIGIGFGESGGLKIEAYRETGTGVESVCAYEQPEWLFANEYKAYYIDRENQLIGLGVEGNMGSGYGVSYILLGFDGFAFRELVKLPVGGNVEQMRGVVIDGWLYVFGDGFDVCSLW